MGIDPFPVTSTVQTELGGRLLDHKYYPFVSSTPLNNSVVYFTTSINIQPHCKGNQGNNLLTIQWLYGQACCIYSHLVVKLLHFYCTSCRILGPLVILLATYYQHSITLAEKDYFQVYNDEPYKNCLDL